MELIEITTAQKFHPSKVFMISSIMIQAREDLTTENNLVLDSLFHVRIAIPLLQV
jgi:hypothetical protein